MQHISLVDSDFRGFVRTEGLFCFCFFCFLHASGPGFKPAMNIYMLIINDDKKQMCDRCWCIA